MMFRERRYARTVRTERPFSDGHKNPQMGVSTLKIQIYQDSLSTHGEQPRTNKRTDEHMDSTKMRVTLKYLQWQPVNP